LVQPHDWEAVERCAGYHSLIPAVAYILTEHGGELVPPNVQQRLKQRFTLIARNNLARIQDWRRAMQVLEAAGVPVISLKGPALALLVYQNVALSQFTDLDLLIRPNDVPKACEVLTCNGYKLLSSLASDRDSDLMRLPGRQIVFEDGSSGAVLEVHWGAFPVEFPFQMPVDLLFNSACREHQGGNDFLSLSREHLFIFLCAHGTKHSWRSLKWLCDLACYVSRFQDLDWELCIRQAKSMNCELVLTHSLLLAQQMLGLTLPDAIDGYVRADSRASRAAALAVRVPLNNPAEMGAYHRFRYHLLFARNWREKLHFGVSLIFLPGLADWERVRLPRHLFFLYYFTRPLRLVLKKSLGKTFTGHPLSARTTRPGIRRI
jgi:hypothetical protein